MSDVTHFKSSLAAKWSGNALGGTILAAGSIVAGTVHSAGLDVSTLGTIANLIVTGTAGFAGGGGTVTNLTVSGTAVFADGGGTVSTLYISGSAGIAAGYGTLARLNAVAGTAADLAITGTVGIAGGMGTVVGLGAVNGTVTGVVRAAYFENTGGTAYGLLTGLGTTCKFTAGTTTLLNGSVGITTGMSRIYGITAMGIRGSADSVANLAKFNGTLCLSALWQISAGGTAMITNGSGVITGGTSPICWVAVGL